MHKIATIISTLRFFSLILYQRNAKHRNQLGILPTLKDSTDCWTLDWADKIQSPVKRSPNQRKRMSWKC